MSTSLELSQLKRFKTAMKASLGFHQHKISIKARSLTIAAQTTTPAQAIGLAMNDMSRIQQKDPKDMSISDTTDLAGCLLFIACIREVTK